MLLKNNRARLITINAPTKQAGQPFTAINLIPAGPAVDVPDKLCKSPYVKALIECGDVTNMGKAPKVEQKPVDDEDDAFAGMNKDELVELGLANELDVNTRMTREQIIAAIENASEE